VSNVPNEPHITAIVRADGTGEVSVDGERSEVHATDVAGARAAVIARVAEEATARDRPVRVATTDLDGVYALIVHPDGNVESEGAILEDGPDEDRADAITQLGSGIIPPPPFGIHALIDFADAEPEPRPGKPFEPARTRRSTFRAYSDEPSIPETTVDSGHGGYRGYGAPDGSDAFPANDATFPPLPDFAESGFGALEADTVTETLTPSQAGPATEADARSDAEASVVAEEPVLDSDPAVSASAPPTHSPPAEAPSDAVPTLEDFLQSRPSAPEGPAKEGWQGFVRRITGGVISPRPGKAEQLHRYAIRRVQRSLKGPRTIVVLNPKGGAHKTTATLLLAATFGIHRGGSTLAWDNNETRGTLGWRAQPSRHSNTAVDLLRDVGRFADAESARVGYLDNYVRGQGDAQFDVLASDEDAAASSTIDAKAFGSLHSTLSRFYRLLVIDTGNNMRASNWEAAVEAADQLVVVTTVNEETAASAAWLLDGLRQKGHQDKVSKAVTILSAPGDAVQPELSQRLHAHFSALTRVVLEVPYDPGFQSGGPLNVEVLSPQTREAWLQVTAAVADGL
jgi:MinD-like ATPase involved in chromosome partitioning or flagellar assembly